MGDKVIGVCVRVEEMPVAGVPSRRERCKDCGAEIWMSENIRADSYICIGCADKDSNFLPPFTLHPQVREDLHALGWTDKEIERVHEISTAALGPHRKG